MANTQKIHEPQNLHFYLMNGAYIIGVRVFSGQKTHMQPNIKVHEHPVCIYYI
jgi:hypothetical protein